MIIAICSGLLGLAYIANALRSNSAFLGCMGCILSILGTLKMVACQFDFPWLPLYCVSMLFLLTLITKLKSLRSCKKMPE